MKNAIGTLLVLFGVSAFVWGSYIGQEVDLREERVSEAEENMGSSRPTVGPVRRRAKSEARANAEQKIGDEKQSLGQIELNSDWLKGTGIVLFIAGIGVLVFRPKN